MNWTADIVKGRFIEACETERRLPSGGLPQASGYWPAYTHSFADMAQWGEKRLAEEREMRFQRRPPSAAAISRYMETLQWTAELIGDEKRRRLVWAWAFCQASGRSFAARCRKEGWIKMTAYRRLNTAMEEISKKLCKNNTFLRVPENPALLPNHEFQAMNPVWSPDHDDTPSHPTFQIFDGDRPRHTLTSPQAVVDFEKLLAQTNKRRRKEQERRRKLGLEEGAA